ncbi:hypothetical protein [Janibacter alittae]|uniref:Uncharacterized protein n=1 Tax=Janibacter alittae TaxID=3115209 RepID=A0ABZ2MLP2_9MICO
MTADYSIEALGADPMRTVTDVAEIERLTDLAGAERAAFQELDCCLTRLRDVWAAQSQLAHLDSETLRGVLAARRAQLGGQSR